MKKPDYQKLGSDGKFHDCEGMALCTSDYFKPVRLLAIPNRGLICLMISFAGDRWIVCSLDVKGVPARSKIFNMRSVGEVMFRELCAELTETSKEHLADVLLDPATTLTGKERTNAALELGRLEIADDELVEGIAAKADGAGQV